MKKNASTTATILLCCFGLMRLYADSPEVERAKNYGAKGSITLRVVDSKSNLVQGAKVMAGFFNQRTAGGGSGITGATDGHGLFTANGTSDGEMHYQIKKSNYYTTEADYWFARLNDPSMVENGRWQPWNPTNTVVLKEKRNPVPMFAKQLDTVMPVENSPIGFDLERGDWIAPYGDGIRPDLYITYTAQPKGIWRFKVVCSNALDGFVRTRKDTWSRFGSDYEAPIGGYESLVVQTLDDTKTPRIVDELGNTELLVFRVQSVTDTTGNIVSAKYGKIYGPTEFGIGTRHYLHFNYYFNPDGTRNLEFNTHSNLFKHLKSLEEVPIP